MGEGICYIFASGEYDGAPWPQVGEEDLVIAADGGYTRAVEAGVPIHLVVGDFDSLGYVPPHPHILRHPVEKDDTDTALALREGWERGYRRFVLYGCLGGRLDHTLANLQLLCGLARKGGRGELVSRNTTITAIHNDTLELDESQRGILSVFCLGEAARGVTIRGLKYTLEGGTLEAHVPLGVSNEFVGRPAHIEVEDGTLLVMRSQG